MNCVLLFCVASTRVGISVPLVEYTYLHVLRSPSTCVFHCIFASYSPTTVALEYEKRIRSDICLGKNYGRRPCMVLRSAEHYYSRRPQTLLNVKSVSCFVVTCTYPWAETTVADHVWFTGALSIITVADHESNTSTTF